MPHVPSYRRHSTGQAFVELRGRRHYLGITHASPESRKKYDRLVAEDFSVAAENCQA